MIKFFRKIRQKLIAEGNTGKYLLYALGEIVLVVIGILIALQLNNQNEKNRTHLKQENYLILIKKEMSNNLKSVEKEQDRLSKSIESQQAILELMRNEAALDSMLEQDLSMHLVGSLSRDIAVNYENGTLSEMISSGSLKDLENDSIRGVLSSWDGKIYQLREQERMLREMWVRNNEFFEKNGCFRTLFDQAKYSDYVQIENKGIEESNKLVLKHKEFENIYLIHLACSFHLHTGVYPEFEKDIQSLIELIDQELGIK